MAEYIGREAITEYLMGRIKNYLEMGDRLAIIPLNFAMAHIKSLPAADVAPVAHGRWEWFDEETGTPFTGYEREWGWRCSCCKHELPDDYDDPDYCPTLNYCYNCGARMDGGGEDG